MLLLFCFILKQLQEFKNSKQAFKVPVIGSFQHFRNQLSTILYKTLISPHLQRKKKRIEDAIAITSSTELSSYEETVATPKPNTQKKTMKCPNSIHRTHVYSTLYARALYTSALYIACMHRNARHYFVRTCTLLRTHVHSTLYARALYFVRAYAPPHYCNQII